MKKAAPHGVAMALLNIQYQLKDLKQILAGSTEDFERVALLATEIRDAANVVRTWAFEQKDK